MFDDALTLHKSGRTADAIHKYKELLKLAPGDVRALAFCAQAHLEDGKPTDCIALLAAAADPLDAATATPVLNCVSYSLLKLASLVEDDSSGVITSCMRSSFTKALPTGVPSAAISPVNMLRCLSLHFIRLAVTAKPKNALLRKQLACAQQACKLFSEAADSYLEAIAIAGGSPPWHWEACYKAAKCLKRAGRWQDAIGAYRACLELKRDHGSCQHWLAVLIATHTSGAQVPASAPASYVRSLYKSYAATFDAHLVGELSYRTPTLLVAELRRQAEALERSSSFELVADLGCGTGLCGVALSGSVSYLCGVDLSPEMVDKATARGIYAELAVDDIVSWLAAQRGRAFDLFCATDVFVYIGSLDGVFAGCAAVAAKGALFAFSTEALIDTDDSFKVLPTGRFAHGKAYVAATAARAGFSIISHQRTELRRNEGLPIIGDLFVAKFQ